MCVCVRVFGCNGPSVWSRGLSVTERANGRLPYIKWVFSVSPGCMYCMWSSVQWSGGRAAPRAPLHFPIENPWLATEGEPHTRPRARRAREVSAPHPQPFSGALSALSVFLLTWEPPGCSPKDSAAGAAAAAAAAAGRLDLRKTEGTPRVRSRRQPARSLGTFPLRQNFGSGEVGGEGRGGRAGGQVTGVRGEGGRAQHVRAPPGTGAPCSQPSPPLPGSPLARHHVWRRRRLVGVGGVGRSRDQRTWCPRPRRARCTPGTRDSPSASSSRLSGQGVSLERCKDIARGQDGFESMNSVSQCLWCSYCVQSVPSSCWAQELHHLFCVLCNNIV